MHCRYSFLSFISSVLRHKYRSYAKTMLVNLSSTDLGAWSVRFRVPLNPWSSWGSKSSQRDKTRVPGGWFLNVTLTIQPELLVIDHVLFDSLDWQFSPRRCVLDVLIYVPFPRPHFKSLKIKTLCLIQYVPC